MELSPYTVVFQIINFLILVFILRRFLFKPVMAIIQQRQEQVQLELEQAAQSREQAEQLHRQGEHSMIEAHQRIEQLLKEASQHAEQLHADAIADAQTRARHLIDEAEVRLRREQDMAREALRQEVARLAVGVAAKALPRALDTEQQRILIDAAIREVSNDGG